MDKIAELKRRIISDLKETQSDSDFISHSGIEWIENRGMQDGIKVALYEIENIDNPYVGDYCEEIEK